MCCLCSVGLAVVLVHCVGYVRCMRRAPALVARCMHAAIGSLLPGCPCDRGMRTLVLHCTVQYNACTNF